MHAALLQGLECCEALRRHEQKVGEGAGRVADLAVDEQLVKVFERQGTARVLDLVEPVFGAEGGLRETADGVRLRSRCGRLEPTGSLGGDGRGPHAVQGLQTRQGRPSNEHALANSFAQAEHHVVHFRFQNTNDGSFTLVSKLLYSAKNNRLGKVAIFVFSDVKGVSNGHRNGFESVRELGQRAVFSENHGLLDSATAGDANQVAALFDCAEQRVREVGVVDQFVAQKLQRGREN